MGQFKSINEECDNLGSRAFSVIELVEIAGVSPSSFEIIRKKLLNLGNDIKRVGEKYSPSDSNPFTSNMSVSKNDPSNPFMRTVNRDGI